MDLDLHESTTVPLNPHWEYALVVTEGAVGLDGQPLAPGQGSAIWVVVATNFAST